ncbi:MAG: hypothetical protein ABSG94_11470 [Brevinematales bacterium]|jgi:hypothetical protein
MPLSEIIKNPVAVIIIILLLIFVAMIFIPQNVLVNISEKLFK